ncbi:putative adenine-specific methylase [Planctomycetales bacterium]|nr:putative adenine-specific methylase [Planctomycetales bacterium]
MSKTSKNTNLQSAKKEKNDEFYTQLADIERECNHYWEHFKGNKTILCNCDDPRVSNFFFYFFASFHALGLKRLIATCYKNLNPDLFSQNKDERAVYCIYDGKDRVDDVIYNLNEFRKQNEWKTLKGDGDFRTDECIELLKQADIVVTNPPFSLFREYVAQLVEYDKKFIIIGNKNAITYKEIFKLIKDNKIWCGHTPMSTDLLFDVPKEFAEWLVKNNKEGSGYKLVDGVVKGRSQSIWFTNLDYAERHEELVLYKHYSPAEYPKYDNYDAINVDKTTDIPMDYAGAMGVPITFLDKYNPDQFEIVGLLADKREISDALIQGIPTYLDDNHKKYVGAVLKGKATYARIIIRHKKRDE